MIQTYASISPIKTYIVPKKQDAKRHYGSHQYFTKRAWNVVRAYIEKFTQPGDVVCDPYGGSGVTAIEAMILGRKGVYLDISQWATFLAEQIARPKVDLGSLQEDAIKIENACMKKINAWWAKSDDEIDKLPKTTRWYPENARLPNNADAEFVEQLFTRRQLLGLSELYHHIRRIKDPVNRDLLRYAFSATLYKCNGTFISAKGRKESRGGSSIFSIFRYKIAKRIIEMNCWDVFARSVSKLIEAKRETNLHIPEDAQGTFIKGYAQNLSDHVGAESVDYIFTDPPYGAHIAYLDLTRMWNAWLGFEATYQDRLEEAIEQGDAKHSAEHYKKKLTDGIRQMFQVLKYDRWMSIVFAHREPGMWDTIVKAAESAGFEYVNTVQQPLNVVWSMHKKKNPLTVLSGELILNFRKVRNPNTLAITSVGSDAVSLIKDCAELSIVHHGGATVDQIYSELVPKLLESGLLGTVSSLIGDITPMLNETFSYDTDRKVYQVKPGKKLGCHIPLEQRIRFYVIDFLNQAKRLGEAATIDDIILNVIPKLKNGVTPERQKILSEIQKIARPVKGKFWAIYSDPQMVFEFAKEEYTSAPVFATPRKAENQYEHNEILLMLAKLGIAAGFKCHVGKKERGGQGGWGGETFAEMSVAALPFLRGVPAFVKTKVEQIDLIWLEAKRPILSFEIEHSTPITTAFERFIEMLKVDTASAERLVIVAPKSRQAKLNDVLNSSHFIGAPMYLETKVRYLWYSDVLDLVDRLTMQQITKGGMLDAALRSMHRPNAKRQDA